MWLCVFIDAIVFTYSRKKKVPTCDLSGGWRMRVSLACGKTKKNIYNVQKIHPPSPFPVNQIKNNNNNKKRGEETRGIVQWKWVKVYHQNKNKKKQHKKLEKIFLIDSKCRCNSFSLSLSFLLFTFQKIKKYSAVCRTRHSTSWWVFVVSCFVLWVVALFFFLFARFGRLYDGLCLYHK